MANLDKEMYKLLKDKYQDSMYDDSVYMNLPAKGSLYGSWITNAAPSINITTTSRKFLDIETIYKKFSELSSYGYTPWVMNHDLPRCCGKTTLLKEYHRRNGGIFMTKYPTEPGDIKYTKENFDRYFRHSNKKYNSILLDEVPGSEAIYDFILDKYDENTIVISLGSSNIW